MNPLEMQDIIKNICTSNNIDCKVLIDWGRHSIGYKYNENKIFFNPDRCINHSKKFNIDIENLSSLQRITKSVIT